MQMMVNMLGFVCSYMDRIPSTSAIRSFISERLLRDGLQATAILGPLTIVVLDEVVSDGRVKQAIHVAIPTDQEIQSLVVFPADRG